MKVSTENITETSVSATEPLTVAQAKSHLRVDISADDTLIGTLITAAREWVEQYCQQSFVQHTYRADLPGFWDVMQLPLGPVQSITSIKYYDTASPNALQTLSTNVYALNHDTVTRNDGQSWESVAYRNDAVQITYTTGWKDTSSPQGTGASVPWAVKQAMLLLIGDSYENREWQVLYPGQLHENRAMFNLLNAYRAYR